MRCGVEPTAPRLVPCYDLKLSGRHSNRSQPTLRGVVRPKFCRPCGHRLWMLHAFPPIVGLLLSALTTIGVPWFVVIVGSIIIGGYGHVALLQKMFPAVQFVSADEIAFRGSATAFRLLCSPFTAKGTEPTPDWYLDPVEASQYRFWNGKQWTEHTAERGTNSVASPFAAAVDQLAAQPGGDLRRPRSRLKTAVTVVCWIGLSVLLRWKFGTPHFTGTFWRGHR
jgi:Protein of unknown function (DUF2510)